VEWWGEDSQGEKTLPREGKCFLGEKGPYSKGPSHEKTLDIKATPDRKGRLKSLQWGAGGNGKRETCCMVGEWDPAFARVEDVLSLGAVKNRPQKDTLKKKR